MPELIAVAMIGGLATVIVGFLGYFGLTMLARLEGIQERLVAEN